MSRPRKHKNHGKRTAKAIYAPHADYRKRGSDRAAPKLLAAVADALNACEKAGIIVQLAHGAVITNDGYVFAVGGGETPVLGTRWASRTRALTPFSDTASDDED